MYNNSEYTQDLLANETSRYVKDGVIVKTYIPHIADIHRKTKDISIKTKLKDIIENKI